MLKNYPIDPVVEVTICGRTALFHEIQLKSYIGFTRFERRRHLKRFLEGKKRAMDVVTLDDKYLKWRDYHAPPTE